MFRNYSKAKTPTISVDKRVKVFSCFSARQQTSDLKPETGFSSGFDPPGLFLLRDNFQSVELWILSPSYVWPCGSVSWQLPALPHVHMERRGATS